MNAELKDKLKRAPLAKYRGIYEYTNASGTYTGVCIVISASHRERDKYVSAIALSPCDRDDGCHFDEVGLRLPDGRAFWVHCGMVTYFRRDRLGKMIYKVSENTMSIIHDGIKKELGMESDLLDDKEDYEKWDKKEVIKHE